MIIIEILVIVCLVILNGYFAMAEIALVSVKKSRLRLLIKQGNKEAEKTLNLVRQSPEMLSTIQIAITAIGIFSGAFGGATVAKYLEDWLVEYLNFSIYGKPISVVIVVMCITYLSLIIGELFPKQIALSNAEKISLSVTGPVNSLMKITKPIVRLLSSSTVKLLKIFRIPPVSETVISEEEIQMLIAEGTEKGIFEEEEKKWLRMFFVLVINR